MVVRTPVWRRVTIPVAGVVPVCGSTLRGTTVGFRMRLWLVVTSAAWCRTHSDEVGVNGTVRVQSVFLSVAEEANFFGISPALSLLPTSSAMPQLGPLFPSGTCGVLRGIDQAF